MPATQLAATTQPTSKRARRRTEPSCERCYFGSRGLCALELGGPCSTFRPDSPDGLTPPVQPTLLVRSEQPGEAELGLAA